MAHLSASLQPHAVALKDPSLKAETMILQLQAAGVNGSSNLPSQLHQECSALPAQDYVDALAKQSSVITNDSNHNFSPEESLPCAEFPWNPTPSPEAIESDSAQIDVPSVLLGGAAGFAAGVLVSNVFNAKAEVSENLSKVRGSVVDKEIVPCANAATIDSIYENSPAAPSLIQSEEIAVSDSGNDLRQLLSQVESNRSEPAIGRDFFADANLNQSFLRVEEGSFQKQNAFSTYFESPELADGARAEQSVSVGPSVELSDEQRNRLIQRLVDANSNGAGSALPELFENSNVAPTQPKRKRSIRRRHEQLSEEKSSSDSNVLSLLKGLAKPLLLSLSALILCSVLAVFAVLFESKSEHLTAVGFMEGRYLTSFQDGFGQANSGQMDLHKFGEMIKGTGKDLLPVPTAIGQRYRSFEISGAVSSNGITLVKRYLPEVNKAKSPPIVFEGNFTDVSQKFISGTWHVQRNGKSAAGNWNARFVETPKLSTMKWGAWRNKQNPMNSAAPTEPVKEDLFSKYVWNDNEPLPSRFGKLLCLCVLLGIALVHLSARFFGLHGLLNTWERERYVPVSLRPQQRKIMKELGRGKASGSLFMGTRMDWHLGEILLPRKLYLTNERRSRNPHFLAIGNSAKGKTRLLANMAMQDIRSDDRAVVIVDSEGSLCDLVLRTMAASADAKELLSRVHVIEPCRTECVLGFNPFLCADSENLLSLANSIVLGFKAVYTETQNQQNQWSQQTANILRNSVLLLILNGENLDALPKLLSDNDFRDVLLESVELHHAAEWKTLIDAWSNYKKLARTDQWLNWIEPILNRVQPLLSDRRISRLLNASDNSVDLEQVLKEKQVLLLRVPEGQLEKGGSLLGSLIITGLKQAALARFERGRDEESPCALYVDELNNFMDAESFDSFCADSRKLKVGLHASLKTLHDLPEDFRTKIQVDFGSIAVFAISKKDADVLGPGIFKVDGRSITKIRPADIMNPFNSAPNMRMASDEEKMNTNRFVGQDEKTFFFHIMGTEAGIFRMTAPEFKDIPRGDINWDLLESIYDEDSGD